MAGDTTQPRLGLRLYIVAQAPNSLRAITNAQAICAEHFAAAYDLEIVDLLAEPLRALDDGVIVTPTLVRFAPSPVRRVIGDLGDRARALLVLESK